MSKPLSSCGMLLTVAEITSLECEGLIGWKVTTSTARLCPTQLQIEILASNFYNSVTSSLSVQPRTLACPITVSEELPLNSVELQLIAGSNKFANKK